MLALQSRNISVFYDENEQVELWGKGLAEELTDVYENRSNLAVMFISKEYANKIWTNHERRAMLSRAARESREYVVPVRFDNTPVSGLAKDVHYLEASLYSPAELAALIAAKLGIKPYEGKAWHVSPPRMTSIAGEVAFDYSRYNGRYIIGRGMLEFETRWGKSDDASILVYCDTPSINGVALGHRSWTDIREVVNAAALDYTSRYQRPRTGQMVLLRNVNGFYAAVQVIGIKDDSREDGRDELRFRYVIQPDRTDSFATIRGREGQIGK